ncbi:hypothetical protein C8R46DRAFT_1025777 [Mycena filopes]|nr:hypothetical protein C8R46DRAFT_1025777 [Mycena filopes]
MSEKIKAIPRDKEAFWFQHRAFLEKAGYRLRPKFNPRFVGPKRYNLDDRTAHHPRKHIMDAERISDGQQVMLKWVSKKANPSEVDIGRFFSTPAMAKNPRNHCIPILEVLQDPQDSDRQIIVMPRLIRFDEPIFDTVGEVIDCFRQIFEGIQFMHENYPTQLYPRGFHPVHSCLNPTNDGLAYSITRTECWPRYYLIDFGLSRRYDPANGPPLERAVPSGDRLHSPDSAGVECNPFPEDICSLGNILKRHFIRSDPSCIGGTHAPLQFLTPLVDAMTHKNAALRPTIGEVIQRFDKECERLAPWQLRRPGQALDWPAWLDHLLRQVRNTFKGMLPLPPRPATTTMIRTLGPRMRSFYTITRTVKMEEKGSRIH